MMALRHVGLWHFSDIPACPLNGRYQGKAECAGRPARSRWCKSITMKE